MPSTARGPFLNSRTRPSTSIPLAAPSVMPRPYWSRPPASDGRELARGGPDVLRGRSDQARLALLLEDVRRPPGRPRAREQAREQGRRDVGVVEHHRGPELDVRGQHAVGLARLELGEGGLLERLGDLDALRADLARGPPQDRGARVLRPVDAVTEAHQALALVERLLHPRLGVALALHRVEHLQ